MKIKKLVKIRLGNDYPIIQIHFNDWLGRSRIRDVYKSKYGSWKYSDDDSYCHYDILEIFNNTSEREYFINTD